MTVSVRSYLMAGAAAATATAIVLTPVQAMPGDITVPAQPTSAQQPLSQAMVDLLAAASRMTAALPNPTLPNPTLPTPSANGVAPAAAVTATPSANALAFPGIENAIINTYDTVEGWVAYGVSLAEWAVGWVPLVGLLAPQIGMLYNFGEAIVGSAVYNFAHWIGGNVNFIQGINNVINDAFTAGINLVNAEIDWVLSFLPPLPPLPFSVTADASTLATATSLDTLRTTLTEAHAKLVKTVQGLADGGLETPVRSLLTGTAIGESAGPDAAEGAVDGQAGTPIKPPSDGTAAEDGNQQQVAAPEAPVATPNELNEKDEVSSVPGLVRESLKAHPRGATGTTQLRPLRPLAEVDSAMRQAAAKTRTDLQNIGEAARKAVNQARTSLGAKPASEPKAEKTVKADKSEDTAKADKSDKE